MAQYFCRKFPSVWLGVRKVRIISRSGGGWSKGWWMFSFRYPIQIYIQNFMGGEWSKDLEWSCLQQFLHSFLKKYKIYNDIFQYTYLNISKKTNWYYFSVYVCYDSLNSYLQFPRMMEQFCFKIVLISEPSRNCYNICTDVGI